MLIGMVTFLLMLVALLAIPLTLSFQVSWRDALQGNVRLSWLFGLVRVPIPLSQTTPPSPEGKASAQKKGLHPGRSSRNKTNVSAVIRNKPFRRRILRFIRDLWHAIGKRDLNLRLRIGLGDPADTGQLWAFLGPVAGMLATAREATVELEPDFFDEVLELDSSGAIRIVPLQIIYLTVALLLSPPVRQAIRRTRQG